MIGMSHLNISLIAIYNNSYTWIDTWVTYTVMFCFLSNQSDSLYTTSGIMVSLNRQTMFWFIFRESTYGINHTYFLSKQIKYKGSLLNHFIYIFLLGSPVLVVEEAGVSPTIGKQLVNFITCGCKSSAPFLLFTKPGANPRRIGDRLVWVVRSNDLTHWATHYCLSFYSFLNSAVCSSISLLFLPLWYLQTVLVLFIKHIWNNPHIGGTSNKNCSSAQINLQSNIIVKLDR
jgi:hypothetical protein